MRLAFLALLLTGCAVQFQGSTKFPSQQALAVIDGWEAAGMPSMPDCTSQLYALSVLQSDADVLHYCQRPVCNATDSNAPCVQECLAYQGGGAFTTGSYAVVVGEHWVTSGTFPHEGLHFLLECNLGNADWGHENTVIWGKPFQAPGSLLRKLEGP